MDSPYATGPVAFFDWVIKHYFGGVRVFECEEN